MDISVIIVEYKDIDIVQRAVKSVFKYAQDVEYEIIVISNSSYIEKDQAEAQQAWLGCRIVFQDNVGFSKAVNKGIDMSAGDFVMLLNPDTEFIDNSLAAAVEFMENQPDVAIIGPKILDNKTQVQDSCREFMTISILWKRMFARITKRASGAILEKRDYSIADQVDWVSGACMLVRKKAIDEAGKMDDRYFMYVEDMDWCRNFNRYEWQVWFFPDWCIEHNAGRGSTGGFNLFNRLMWIHVMSLIKYKVKWFNEN